MALFVRGATSASSTSASTTKSITVSVAPGSANVLLVFAAGVGVDITKITDNVDTVGTTWSRRAGPETNTVEGSWWGTQPGVNKSGVTSITVTFASSTRSAATYLEYSGVNAYGQNVIASGSSTNPNASITTQDNNNLVLCGMSREGTSTWSAHSGQGALRESLAGAGSTTPGIGVAENTSATPASVTAGATISSSGAWIACAIELRSISPLSGSGDGVGSASATVKGTGSLSGSVTGVAAASGQIKGAGAIIGAAAGKASANAALQAIFEIVASGSVRAAVIAALKGSGAIVSAGAAHASTTATAKGAGALSADGTERASASSTLSARGNMSASAAAKTSTSSTLTAKGALSVAASRRANGAVSLSGASSGTNVDASGAAVSSGSATVSATGELSASASCRANCSTTARGDAFLDAIAVRNAIAAARLSAFAAFASDGSVLAGGSAMLAVPASPTQGVQVPPRSAVSRAWCAVRGIIASSRPKGDNSGPNH